MNYRGLKETMAANLTALTGFMYVMKDHITKDDLLQFHEEGDTTAALTFIAENTVMCCGTSCVGAVSSDNMHINVSPNSSMDGIVGNQVKYDSFTIYEPTSTSSGVTAVLNNVLIYTNTIRPHWPTEKSNSGTNIIKLSEDEIAVGGPISVPSIPSSSDTYNGRYDMHPSTSSTSAPKLISRVTRSYAGTYTSSGYVYEIRYFEEIETDIFFMQLSFDYNISTSVANTRLRVYYYDEEAGTWVYLINRAYVANSKLCGYKFPKVKAYRFRFVLDSTMSTGNNATSNIWWNKVGFGLQNSTYVNKTLNPKVAVVVTNRRNTLSGVHVANKFGSGNSTDRYIVSTESEGGLGFTNPLIEGNANRLRAKSLPIGEDLIISYTTKLTFMLPLNGLAISGSYAIPGGCDRGVAVLFEGDPLTEEDIDEIYATATVIDGVRKVYDIQSQIMVKGRRRLGSSGIKLNVEGNGDYKRTFLLKGNSIQHEVGNASFIVFYLDKSDDQSPIFFVFTLGEPGSDADIIMKTTSLDKAGRVYIDDIAIEVGLGEPK